MCGISAFVELRDSPDSSRRTNGPVSAVAVEEQLGQSLEIIRHRGPDAQGSWFSPDHGASLGHVRLSIVDLRPNGNQPFVDEKDGIIAVVNGELYGHEKLRAELAGEYDFQGESDCEIVIASYKHYGFSSHLVGEFAFVLWDSKRELLFAARDRYGIKSLYYTIHGNRLLVATEMKCFLKFGWKPKWCVETLRGHSWQHGTQTFFQGVSKILPAHYLVCRGHSRDLQQVMYWDSDFPDKRTLETRSETEMIEGVRERLVEAVRVRLRANVPVGVYLSGGLDSSSIAGIVTHLIANEKAELGNDASGDLSRLSCFTVQFDKDSGADESEIAQRTADWLGVQFHPVHMDEAALAARLEDSIWYSETPFPDVNGIGKLALSEKVCSLGIKVVLTGEGSDEHFGGYADFRPDAIQEPDLSWPPSHFPDAEREKVWREKRENMGAVIYGDGSFQAPPSTPRMVNHTHTMRELAKVGFLPWLPWTDGFLSAGDPETLLAESVDGRSRERMAEKWHLLHRSCYIWLKSFMPTFILRYGGDNIDMAYSVESRLPFLDHRLTEYANQVPPSLKMKYEATRDRFDEKYILRQAVRPFVTDEIFARRKKPYSGPTQYKQGQPVHRVLERLLARENVDQLGFVEADAVRSYLDKAFLEGDRQAFRNALFVAQFVVISQRFGVETARPTWSQ